MRRSKYLFKQFGEWQCTHVGVARTQPKNYKGTRLACKRPHHNSYYYLFERITSDNIAIKQVRLNHREAAAVYRGDTTVEAIVETRESKLDMGTTTRINYHDKI